MARKRRGTQRPMPEKATNGTKRLCYEKSSHPFVPLLPCAFAKPATGPAERCQVPQRVGQVRQSPAVEGFRYVFGVCWGPLSRGLKVFGREIMLQEFQPMQSRCLNVTDRQTDGEMDGQADNFS